VAKYVDVEKRRQEVSEAAWRVLVRDGLAGLSVRNVAAEAGLPPSSLRYTFPTQTSVRERAIELVLARLLARVEAVDTPAPSPAWARAVLHELLPLDAERRMEMEVFLALGTAAMTDVALRHAHRETHTAVRAVCARAVSALLLGIPDPGGFETERLHALIDGLALHIIRQDPAEETSWATATLDEHLSRLAKKV
jgi:AcrR family transcriptional regulator